MTDNLAESGPRARLFWGAALTAVTLDVITKYYAVKHLFPHQPKEIVGEVLRFTLAYNPGAAFSMSVGDASRYVFGGFAFIALIILWKLYRESTPAERLKPFALGCAWGGAAGNLIDRIRSERGVVDFIDIGIGGTRFWTFNVADAAVSVGAVLLGWVLLQEDRAQRRQDRENRQSPAGDARVP
ncbi:MAG TPA: signal peptidase II [Gemmatimonadaceae bacterium]|nr:signal peptidase II [Gemmatimonadaceae bacterium]